MPYFKDLNLLFIHIPRTGGTSLDTYFADKCNVILNEDILFGGSLNHCKLKDLYNNFNIDFNNINIITVVRNPYDRIISDLFFYKLINTTMNSNEVYNNVYKFLKTDENKYANHKLPQYLYLLNNNIIDDKIIIMKTETLKEDMIKNGYLDFNNKVNVTFKDKIDYMTLLNKQSIELINTYYAKDFEYFNYTMIKSYVKNKNHIIIQNLKDLIFNHK